VLALLAHCEIRAESPARAFWLLPRQLHSTRLAGWVEASRCHSTDQQLQVHSNTVGLTYNDFLASVLWCKELSHDCTCVFIPVAQVRALKGA
jgi:hypothetical protein